MVLKLKNKRLIIRIEAFLNRTPNLGILIAFGILLTMIATAIISQFTDQFVYASLNPVTLEREQSLFEVKNYLHPENIIQFISNGLNNFSSFGSTTTILVTIIAFGIAEKSGLMYTMFKSVLFKVPKRVVTLLIVFVGIISNVTSTVELNAGYVLLLPLSAFIYMGNGRNPLAGIAAMFAAIFAGYNINVFITSHEIFLNDITTSVVSNAIPTFSIASDANNYIMIVLIVAATFVITYITETYIVNILPIYDLEAYTYHRMTHDEKRGLFVALVYTVITVFTYIYFILPENVLDAPGSGLLLGNYNPQSTTYVQQLIKSQFFAGFAIHTSYYFIIAGSLYGIVSKKFGSLSDIIKSAVVAVADNAEYFVLAFLISQFMFIMYDSNLTLLLVVKLTDLVSSSGNLLAMSVSLFVITAVLNILVPSSVTKWSIIAPAVLPLFISNLVNPVFVQTVFQLGDSATNTISIFMPFTIFAYTLFHIYAKKTKQHCGNGTYFKLTVPYSIALTATYLIVIASWVLLNIDLGPGSSIFI